MGFRFRKIISVLPGVRLNLSKTRASTSIGGKGLTFNVGADGRRTVTFGIPGSGLSYQAPLSGVVFLGLLAVAALIGIVYLVQPTLVTQVLHWWQPKWF